MKKQTKEWLKAAKDDLIVMQEIIENVHVTHMVAFHAQQCVEKSFKAVFEEYEQKIIKVHSLVKLLSEVKKHLDFDVDDTLLDALDTLYTDARYPGEIGLLPKGKPTIEDAKEFYAFAKSVNRKIAEMLKEI